MSAPPPMAMRWDGEQFKPLYPRYAEKHYVVGEVYQMVPHEQRSKVSHDHYFVNIDEIFKNLPEAYTGRWLNPDELRAHALIHTGYHNPPQHFICTSRAEAERWCRYLATFTHEYSETVIDGLVVTRLTARSQSYRAMKKREFQDSKTKTLDYLANMIGVSVDDLQKVRTA